MTLDDAARLLDWMREHGVRHARLGDLELWIDTEPVGLGDDSRDSLPMPEPTPSDPLDDPALFGGEVPNFHVKGDE